MYCCDILFDSHCLMVFDNRMLRMFAIKGQKVAGGWNKFHDEGRHNLYRSPGIRLAISSLPHLPHECSTHGGDGKCVHSFDWKTWKEETTWNNMWESEWTVMHVSRTVLRFLHRQLHGDNDLWHLLNGEYNIRELLASNNEDVLLTSLSNNSFVWRDVNFVLTLLIVCDVFYIQHCVSCYVRELSCLAEQRKQVPAVVGCVCPAGNLTICTHRWTLTCDGESLAPLQSLAPVVTYFVNVNI